MLKHYRLLTLVMLILLCLTSGLVLAQDATAQPSAALPPLVPCVEGQNLPCVQNVEQASDLAGTWRSYIRDSDGLHFGFTVYKEDGSIAILTNLQAAPTVIGSVVFANGIGTLTMTNNTATNCIGNGSYEIRLIRLGDQPVALTYHTDNPAATDICFGRDGVFIQPMIYYSGTGKELSTLDPSSDALAQSLVPCLSLPRPCDVIATKVDDLKGYWKTYFSIDPSGVGLQRFTDAGGMTMVGSGNDPSTYKDFFPSVFPHSFNRALYSSGIPSDTDDCAASVDYMRVIKVGNQPVALKWTAVQDACTPRNASYSDAMIWIKGL